MQSVVITLTILLLFTNELKADYFPSEYEESSQCELIEGECSDQGYEFTSSSRLVSDGSQFANQKAADAFIKSFELMLPCSNYMKIFLCATYKPSCYEEAALIVQPCRSMCEHVYKQCFPVMDRFGMVWRPELNCTRFLDDSSGHCMKDPGYSKDTKPSTDYLKQIDILLGLKSKEKLKSVSSRKDPYSNYVCLNSKHHPAIAPSPFLAPQTTESGSSYDTQCLLKCNANNIYDSEQKQLARVFTAIVSFMSAVTVLVTILGLIVHKKSRVGFTNSLFIILSICYLAYSVLSFTGIMLGPNTMTCQTVNFKRIQSFDQSEVSTDSSSYLVKLDNVYENNLCSTSLLLGYFFQTVALNLWLLLTLWWSMIIQFDIDSDNFKHLTFLCLIIMLLPFTQTGLVFANEIGSFSELTGLCTIGRADKSSLLKYIILPHSSCLFIGIFCLLAGFYNIMCKSPNPTNNNNNIKPRQQTHDTKKDQIARRSSLIRTGVIALLCSLPTLIVLLCEIFEFFNTKNVPEMPTRIYLTYPNSSQFAHFLDVPSFFNFKFKNQFGTDSLSKTASQRLLVIELIKILMSFLNGLLICTVCLMDKNFRKMVNTKCKQAPNPANRTAKQEDNESSSQGTIAEVTTNTNNSLAEPYATQDCYERACQLGALREHQSTLREHLSHRPVSDHIYYQPGCSSGYQSGNQLNGGIVQSHPEYSNRFKQLHYGSSKLEKVVRVNDSTVII